MTVAVHIDLIRALVLACVTEPGLSVADALDLMSIEESCNAIEARQRKETAVL